MRKLLIGALGLVLAGCSHSAPPPAAITSCSDASPCSGNGTPAPPIAHASVRSRTASARAVSHATKGAGVAKPVHTAKAAAKPAGNAAFGAAKASMDKHSAGPAAAAPADPDRLVAVVMARPDITSVAELAGKTIAIDDRYAAASASVRTAIVAAGAPQVQLSEGQTTAVNRLTNGEVPAAVLALVSPEAAEAFPAIAGYHMFHVPLSPQSERTRP